MMDKVLSQLSSFLRKIAHLPSIVIWDGFMEYTCTLVQYNGDHSV